MHYITTAPAEQDLPRKTHNHWAPSAIGLLESRARTIEQMRLINALCRFAEMAGEQAG